VASALTSEDPEVVERVRELTGGSGGGAVELDQSMETVIEIAGGLGGTVGQSSLSTR
jgi:hypothetical protein